MSFKRPEIKTTSLLKEVTNRYNKELKEAAEKKEVPIGWVTAVSPVEILWAMDIFPYYPENYGTLVGAKKMTRDFSQAAEAQGYPVDICSYAKAGFGAVCMERTGDENPLGELAHPDIIVSCNSQCISLQKWFSNAGKEFQVPYFNLDFPIVHGELTSHIKDYLMEQLQELIEFLEKATGKKMDYSRLQEVLALSNEACALWNDVLEMATYKPARFTFFDACIHMAPIVNWRGTQVAVDYYKALKDELLTWIENDIQSIPGEKYRLYWDHIPIWASLRFFSEYFGENKAAVLCSLYTHSWAYNFDISRPLETLAENYSAVFVNRGFGKRISMKMDLMKRYSVDGFVFNLNRSCKPNSLTLYDKKRAISERTGVPGMVFEADMCDKRFIDEDKIKRQLDAFLEQIDKVN